MIDEDDEQNCFFLYALPDVWMPYLAFSKPVSARVFGEDSDRLVFPALRVIPMGWLSSCDVLQDIARGIALKAGADPLAEITPLAKLTDLTGEAWQNYIDNYFVFRVRDAAVADGLPSALAERVRRAKGKLGIPLHVKKRKDGALEGKVLGAYVDGVGGTVGVKATERQLLMVAGLFLLYTPYPLLPDFLSWLGKWTFAAQFVRALFSICHHVYHVADQYGPRYRGPVWLKSVVLEEVLIMVMLLPLADANLRKPLLRFSDVGRAGNGVLVSASDASPTGGAAGFTSLDYHEASELVRQSEFRGAAVRLSDVAADLPLGRKMKPCTSFDPRGRRWQVAHAYPWRVGQHITLLEAHAVLLWLRKLLRHSFAHRRLLHVLDSYVCVATIAKGRSSSIRLNRILRRIAALLLFADLSLHPLWTRSELMPMDAPSRIKHRQRPRVPPDR